MKHAQSAAIRLSIVLGILALMGCQRGEPTTTANPAAETLPEPTASSAEETATAASETTEAEPTDAGETPINPPQSASLTAQEANAEINVRSQPTVESTSTGYGLAGDAVKLLKTVDGDDGFAWYYVEFDEWEIEGWVRGDLIDTGSTATATETPEATTTPNTAANLTDDSETNGTAYAVTIDSYTSGELFAVDGGGCGMSLKPIGNDEFIFFNGIDDESMWMKLDGTMTQFRKTSASGEDFYGQSTTQSFTSIDEATQVDVSVQLGTEVGYEAVDVESGTLRLENAGEVVEIPVEGDAGC